MEISKISYLWGEGIILLYYLTPYLFSSMNKFKYPSKSCHILFKIRIWNLFLVEELEKSAYFPIFIEGIIIFILLRDILLSVKI